MNHEDVQKVSNAANAKITLLQNNFLKYFMRAVMAGFFIVVAIDRKSTRLNSSHWNKSRMPSSA